MGETDLNWSIALWPGLLVGILGLIGIVGGWWLWWRLPKRQADRLRLTIRDAKARADVEDNFRKTIGQLLGGAAVLLGAGFAYLQFQQQQRSAHDLLISNQVSRGFEQLGSDVTGGAFPRKVGGENRTVTAGRRPWWPRMAGLQPLSTRAFGPRLRRLTALTALATRPLIATKRSTVRCGQSVCKCHAEKFRSAIFARILTAVHTATSSRIDSAAFTPLKAR